AFRCRPFDANRRIERVKDAIEPRRSAQHCRFAREHRGLHALPGRNERSGDIAAGCVLTQRGGDLCVDVVRQVDQNGRPWNALPMHISIGIDRMKLMREALPAVARAAAFCSSVALTMPSTFFWFGQMRTQTLNSMIVPSHAPVPITSW